MNDRATCVYQSPLGPLRLSSTPQGICAIEFLAGRCTRGAFEREYDRDLTTNDSDAARQHLRVCAVWLDAYFDRDREATVAMPLMTIPAESEFFYSVRNALAGVPAGTTISYRDLASKIGRPTAARAVGQAMKKNPLPLLIPCHRVVKSGRRDIGGYSGGDGTVTKQWLLEHERQKRQQNPRCVIGRS